MSSPFLICVPNVCRFNLLCDGFATNNRKPFKNKTSGWIDDFNYLPLVVSSDHFKGIQ
jgi:hypothetical protein